MACEGSPEYYPTYLRPSPTFLDTMILHNANSLCWRTKISGKNEVNKQLRCKKNRGKFQGYENTRNKATLQYIQGDLTCGVDKKQMSMT